MTRCDCGAFESCDVCIALAERDLGPYTAEDYGRGYRIAVDPALGGAKTESAEIYSDLCLQIVHVRAHALLVGLRDRF